MYPHLRIHIYSGNAEEVKEKLSAQQIDFAITFGTPTIQGQAERAGVFQPGEEKAP